MFRPSNYCTVVVLAMTAAANRSPHDLSWPPPQFNPFGEFLSWFSFHFTGRLLDATKNYMYVFMLAGCEVVLSALVLAICNLLFIKRKPQQPDPPAKMEMAITETEMEELNKAAKDDQDNGGGAETGKKQAIEPESKTTSEDEVKEPESIEVDSIEVENASKKVSEPNGVAVEPESSL